MYNSAAAEHSSSQSHTELSDIRQAVLLELFLFFFF